MFSDGWLTGGVKMMLVIHAVDHVDDPCDASPVEKRLERIQNAVCHCVSVAFILAPEKKVAFLIWPNKLHQWLHLRNKSNVPGHQQEHSPCGYGEFVPQHVVQHDYDGDTSKTDL